MTPTVGRNDPCPCGSGKKHKKCCLRPGGNGRHRLANIAVRSPPGGAHAAERAVVWQLDIVPFPATFSDDPGARPAAVLVVADGFVLATEMIGRAPSEIDDIADLLEGVVRSVGESAGGWPERVEVRHPEIAAELRERVGTEGIRIAVPGGLDDLDEVAIRLARDVGGWPLHSLPTSMPDTWAAWGLPRERIAELFRAAAEFRRAEPWAWLPNERLLTVELPDGREWTAIVLGNGGEEYGIMLYSDPFDLEAVYGSLAPMDAFVEPDGRVLSLAFDSRGDLPRPMQREIISAGWEIADADAYPTLLARNTPAGGVSRRDAADLCAALRGISALAREMPDALAAPERAERRDAGTGVEIVLHAVDESRLADWTIDLWTPPETLSASGPEGPGARPERVLHVVEGDGLVEWLAGARAVADWESETRWARSDDAAADGGDARSESGSPAKSGSPAAGGNALQLAFGGREWEDSFEDAPPDAGGADDESGAGLAVDGFEDEFDDEFDDDTYAPGPVEKELERLDTAVTVTIDLFFRWLLIDRGLSLDTARKHARNAANFTSFLYITAAVPIAAVTEYDLRQFLFEWYPKKLDHARYRVEAMPVSLGRFFEWLAEVEGIHCPWAEQVLSERDAYADRYAEFPGGAWWDRDVAAWSAELWHDLGRRVMLSDAGLGETGEWGVEGPLGRTMGPGEARLEHELTRRWLLWRDEEIRAGVTEPEPLGDRLVQRQRAWEKSPHPGLDGLTPIEAIEREREERRREG